MISSRSKANKWHLRQEPQKQTVHLKDPSTVTLLHQSCCTAGLQDKVNNVISGEPHVTLPSSLCKFQELRCVF